VHNQADAHAWRSRAAPPPPAHVDRPDTPRVDHAGGLNGAGRPTYGHEFEAGAALDDDSPSARALASASGAIESPGKRSTDDDQRQLARGGALSLIGSAVNAISQFLLVIIVTQALTESDAGLVFEAIAAFSIASGVATLGADVTLLRWLGNTDVRSRYVRQTVRLAALPALLVATALGAALFVGAGTFARWMTGAAHVEALTELLRITAPAIPAGAAILVLLAASRGLGTMTPTVIVDRVGRPIVQLAAVWVASLFGAGAAAIMFGWAVPYAVAAIASAAIVAAMAARSKDGDAAGLPSEWSSAAFWRFTAARSVSNALSLIIRWFDTIMVGALLGASSAAVYTAATRLLTTGNFVNVAIMQAAAPKIGEGFARGSWEVVQKAYRTATLWLVVIVWPVYLAMAVAAPRLLSIFGEEFVGGTNALRILIVGMLIATACGPVEMVQLLSGRTVVNLITNAASLATNIGLNLVLIPRYELTGAAVAWVVSLVLNNVLPLYQVWRADRHHPGSVALFASIVAGLLIVLGSGIVALQIFGETWATIGMWALAAGVLYIAFLWRYRSLLELDDLANSMRRSRR